MSQHIWQEEVVGHEPGFTQQLHFDLMQPAVVQVLKERLINMATKRQSGMLRQVLQAWQTHIKRQAKKQQVCKALEHRRTQQLTAFIAAWRTTVKVQVSFCAYSSLVGNCHQNALVCMLGPALYAASHLPSCADSQKAACAIFTAHITSTGC